MYKYLRIGISSVTPTGDRNKYKFVICDDINKKKNVNDLK